MLSAGLPSLSSSITAANVYGPVGNEFGENFTNNLKRNDFFQIWVDQNLPKPYKWVIWAHNQNGWAERVEQIL